jgi:hypothetical protein
MVDPMVARSLSPVNTVTGFADVELLVDNGALITTVSNSLMSLSAATAVAVDKKKSAIIFCMVSNVWISWISRIG